MEKRKYLFLGICLMLPLTVIFSQCYDNTKPADPRGDNYAGAASCIKCHKNVYEQYTHTAHFQTSRPALQPTIHGSFNTGLNTVKFNDSVKVMMEKQATGLYQVSYLKGKPIEKHRFDITFGKKNGETYLYWKGNQVYQLPVTYFLNIHAWANSPGYNGDYVDFNRMMGHRCFECHSSYIQNIPHNTGFMQHEEWFDKKSLILSIDCERCHGPAAAHVNFHLQNPDVKKAMYITRIGSLSRAQRMDMCSVCHSGNSSVMTRSTFDFKPGDTLANYKEAEFPQYNNDKTKLDVHGNQVQLLTSSQCFIKGKIECATCHSLHENKAISVKMYSQKCMECHSEANHNFCTVGTNMGAAIRNNCLDCHMPIQSSSVIVAHTGKQTIAPFHVRTHHIAVYPEESKKIYQWLKAGWVAQQ